MSPNLQISLSPSLPLSKSPSLLNFHTLGFLSALSWGGLAWRSHQDEPIPLWIYFTVMGITWSAMLVAWFIAKPLAEPHLRRALLIWALVFHGIGFFGKPIYEDDWARYLWDGRMMALSGNPYDSTPMRHFRDKTVTEDFEKVLDEINNPDLPTIYPPVCQYVFAFGYVTAPAKLWPLKLVFIAAQLGILWLVLRLVGPRRAIWYGWCPLLIQETAFTAHPDVLWVFPIMLAFLAVRRQKYPALAAVACGLAFAAKVFAIVLVPFLLVRLAKRYWLVTAATVTACYLPFWLQRSGADLANLKAMAQGWEFNSMLFAPLASWTSDSTARLFCLGLFAAFWFTAFVLWCRSKTLTLRGDLLMGAFFLTTNVMNPWYLAGLAPFVAIRPSAWGIAALVVVSLTYAHGLTIPDATLAPYELASCVKPTEAIVLFAALCWSASGSLRVRFR